MVADKWDLWTLSLVEQVPEGRDDDVGCFSTFFGGKVVRLLLSRRELQGGDCGERPHQKLRALQPKQQGPERWCSVSLAVD